MPRAHRILLISHSLGGGVEEHVSDLRLLLSDRAQVDVLRPAGDRAVTLQCSDDMVLTWRSDDWPKLIEVLRARNYQRVHLHHVHGFPTEILRLPEALGVPYDVTLHDYLTYCPQYQLGTANGSYCGEPEADGCAQCLQLRPHPWGGTIGSWRTAMAQFLERASRIIAPTAFVSDRTKLHFPLIKIDHQQHPPRANWLTPPVQQVKVAILGALSRIKGLETLIACATQAHSNSVPLTFCLIGFPGNAIPPGLPVQIRGQYDDKDLPHLLALERADVVWFPGHFPETHSYTLDVALASGLPIVASARGAFFERLNHLQQATLLLADADPSEWNLALIHAGGVSHDQTLVSLERATPALVKPESMRSVYADYLLAPLAGLPAADEAKHLDIERKLATAVPRQPDLPLTTLFEHGVLCGKREPKLALERRLVEIERDYEVLEGYQTRSGRPWYALLDEAQRLQPKIERMTTDIERMTTEIKLVTSKNEQLRLEEVQTRLEITKIAEAHDQDMKRAIAQIRAFEASTSWRLTAPLREVGSVIKVIRFKATRLRQVVRQGLQKLPFALSILRNQGFKALALRVKDKVNGQAYQAPEVGTTAIEPIGALSLQSAPAGRIPKVSLVIPVYGQHLHTFNCLKSLSQHTDLSDIEVILVDDASPEPVALALKYVQGIQLTRNEENLGFIGSCHRGADLARGEYLVLLNNDIQVTPGWLESLLDVFRMRADAGLVGARLVYPDGRLQEAGGIVWRDGSAWNWGRNGDPEHPIYRYLRAADYCSGACLALKRADWVSWGGFDRAYVPAYYEDTDLAFRVRAAGKRVYYQPDAKIIHFEGVSSGTDLTQGVKKHQVINREVFLTRWRTTLQSHRENGVEPTREADRQAKSHVLIVEACMITPDQDSGSVRMLAMLEILLELGHKVSFVADNLECRQPYARTLQQAGVEVWHHPYIASVAQLLEERGKTFDLILFCRHYIATPYMANIRKWAPQAKIVFDTVDLHYLREQRKAELESSASMLATAQRTRAQELAVIQQSDITLVVSPVEQSLLAIDAPGAVVRIVSNIHEPRRANTSYAEREGLLFIGGFRHPPNIDAVEWFVAQVWPLVRLQMPQVVLTVVGSHMPESIRALAGNGIVTAGFVEDIDPIIDAARVSIAPLRYGAGVKGKINQAMACGLPVVATSVAVEGMSLAAGEEILVADQPKHYADEIVRLYCDVDLWSHIAERGYQNVQTHFSRDTAKKALASLLDN
jgi:GT2 family glycosyltransferase/glycosyltransferase involved in cell wall biosynthesis